MQKDKSFIFKPSWIYIMLISIVFIACQTTQTNQTTQTTQSNLATQSELATQTLQT